MKKASKKKAANPGNQLLSKAKAKGKLRVELDKDGRVQLSGAAEEIAGRLLFSTNHKVRIEATEGGSFRYFHGDSQNELEGKTVRVRTFDTIQWKFTGAAGLDCKLYFYNGSPFCCVEVIEVPRGRWSVSMSVHGPEAARGPWHFPFSTVVYPHRRTFANEIAAKLMDDPEVQVDPPCREVQVDDPSGG